MRTGSAAVVLNGGQRIVTCGGFPSASRSEQLSSSTWSVFEYPLPSSSSSSPSGIPAEALYGPSSSSGHHLRRNGDAAEASGNSPTDAFLPLRYRTRMVAPISSRHDTTRAAGAAAAVPPTFRNRVGHSLTSLPHQAVVLCFGGSLVLEGGAVTVGGSPSHNVSDELWLLDLLDDVELNCPMGNSGEVEEARGSADRSSFRPMLYHLRSAAADGFTVVYEARKQRPVSMGLGERRRQKTQKANRTTDQVLRSLPVVGEQRDAVSSTSIVSPGSAMGNRKNNSNHNNKSVSHNPQKESEEEEGLAVWSAPTTETPSNAADRRDGGGAPLDPGEDGFEVLNASIATSLVLQQQSARSTEGADEVVAGGGDPVASGEGDGSLTNERPARRVDGEGEVIGQAITNDETALSARSDEEAERSALSSLSVVERPSGAASTTRPSSPKAHGGALRRRRVQTCDVAGAWPAARRGHSAMSVCHGRMLMMGGGSDSFGNVLNDCHFFFPLLPVVFSDEEAALLQLQQATTTATTEGEALLLGTWCVLEDLSLRGPLPCAMTGGALHAVRSSSSSTSGDGAELHYETWLLISNDLHLYVIDVVFDLALLQRCPVGCGRPHGRRRYGGTVPSAALRAVQPAWRRVDSCFPSRSVPLRRSNFASFVAEATLPTSKSKLVVVVHGGLLGSPLESAATSTTTNSQRPPSRLVMSLRLGTQRLHRIAAAATAKSISMKLDRVRAQPEEGEGPAVLSDCIMHPITTVDRSPDGSNEPSSLSFGWLPVVETAPLCIAAAHHWITPSPNGDGWWLGGSSSRPLVNITTWPLLPPSDAIAAEERSVCRPQAAVLQYTAYLSCEPQDSTETEENSSHPPPAAATAATESSPRPCLEATQPHQQQQPTPLLLLSAARKRFVSKFLWQVGPAAPPSDSAVHAVLEQETEAFEHSVSRHVRSGLLGCIASHAMTSLLCRYWTKWRQGAQSQRTDAIEAGDRALLPLEEKPEGLTAKDNDRAHGSGAAGKESPFVMDRSLLCCECFAVPREIIGKPCGHLALCSSCFAVTDACPLCDTELDVRGPPQRCVNAHTHPQLYRFWVSQCGVAPPPPPAPLSNRSASPPPPALSADTPTSHLTVDEAVSIIQRDSSHTPLMMMNDGKHGTWSTAAAAVGVMFSKAAVGAVEQHVLSSKRARQSLKVQSPFTL